MIHYQLRCAQEHEFDGWFKDSAGFDRQAKRGLVECPICGDTIRSVSYSGYTVAYCPTCQTAGKVLADNTTSKFLK